MLPSFQRVSTNCVRLHHVFAPDAGPGPAPTPPPPLQYLIIPSSNTSICPSLLPQVASICTESVRLTLVQILLQKRGIKMNPVSSLYHIAPCCFVFLFLPFTYIELPKMISDPNLHINVPLLLLSASVAFGELSPVAGHGLRVAHLICDFKLRG